MTVRELGLVRVGFRRIGAPASTGLPYTSPLVPDAVVTINHAGTSATTSAALLFNPSGEGTLALLFDGTTYSPVTDQAVLLVKKTSGVQSAIFDGGGFSENLIELRNGGGGTTDKIFSTNVNGFSVGGNVGGFNNSGITFQPGTVGNAFMTLTSDQLSFQSTRVGFFAAAAAPVTARAKTTAGPAGGTYNATAQAMLNDCFNTLKGLGFLV